jgi:hypothetical protein
LDVIDILIKIINLIHYEISPTLRNIYVLNI